jgi:hypothetical protein
MMRPHVILMVLVPAAASAFVSACSGSCGCPETGGHFSDAGPFEPAPYASADVQSTLAQCDLPHGPVFSPATYGDKRAFMLGAWIACPPPAATVFDPAIAFRADGAFRRFTSDGNGGLVAGTGVDDTGTYSFSYGSDARPTDGDPWVGLVVGAGGINPLNYDSPLTLEMAPSRMLALFHSVDPSVTSFDVWLVRLP